METQNNTTTTTADLFDCRMQRTSRQETRRIRSILESVEGAQVFGTRHTGETLRVVDVKADRGYIKAMTTEGKWVTVVSFSIPSMS